EEKKTDTHRHCYQSRLSFWHTSSRYSIRGVAYGFYDNAKPAPMAIPRDIVTGLVIVFSRYLPIIAPIAMAASLGAKKSTPFGMGTRRDATTRLPLACCCSEPWSSSRRCSSCRWQPLVRWWSPGDRCPSVGNGEGDNTSADTPRQPLRTEKRERAGVPRGLDPNGSQRADIRRDA